MLGDAQLTSSALDSLIVISGIFVYKYLICSRLLNSTCLKSVKTSELKN